MKESRDEKRKRLIAQSRATVSEAYSSMDHPIMQAINTYKEIDKIKGIIYERMEEWYGIYFPEVKTTNQDSYADIIAVMKSQEDANEETINKILGDEGKKVVEEIRRAESRPKLEDAEYEALKELAKSEKELSLLQKTLDKYLEESVKRAMPNISYLIDYKIAAEMLSKAGSLNRLASFPASTIQLLGAEKALFKHLKFGSKPPKYGVLFKLPQLSNASKHQRGKLARAYATKVSIAARADAYTKRFIADKLKESLDKTVETHNERELADSVLSLLILLSLSKPEKQI